MLIKVIVHCPESAEGIEQLRKCVAQAHAQAVISYIRRLSCPQSQKTALFKAISSRHQAAQD